MDWENRLLKAGAIWSYPGSGPHAQHMLSGKHADFYWNSDNISCDPQLLKQICTALIEQIHTENLPKPDWVVTYPPFGSALGFCLAEMLGAKFAQVHSLELAVLHFDLRASERAFVCADDLYTGGSMEKVVKAVSKRGAEVVGPIIVVANFSGSNHFQGRPVVSLLNRTIETWDADKCPLCASGSEPLLARGNWQTLSESQRSNAEQASNGLTGRPS